MSTSRSSAHSEWVLRLPRRALRIAAIAFGVGLLLFVMVWLGNRNDGFYQPEVVQEGHAPVLQALPEPLPAQGGASGLEEPRQASQETAPVAEPVPLPASIDDTSATPTVAAPTPTTPSPAEPTVTLAPGDQAVPVPGQMPSPRYPASALRRGETGTVMVRVDVGADGVPTQVEIETRSGSLDLDRAALEAVRQWHFYPAQREGQAVASRVVVPIAFDLKQ